MHVSHAARSRARGASRSTAGPQSKLRHWSIRVSYARLPGTFSWLELRGFEEGVPLEIGEHGLMKALGETHVQRAIGGVTRSE